MDEKMKAAIWTKYGTPDVLHLTNIDKPIPKENEILIKIHSATATAGDCEMRNLKLPFLFRLPMRIFIGIIKPKRIQILGMELSGIVEETGKEIKRFKKGDHVIASTGFNMGAYAQYVCLREEPGEMDGPIAIKPQELSFEKAATISIGGLEALHAIKESNVTKEKKVLINGSGGTIGTYALQLAKNIGAEVTCVDSEDKLEMLKSIGADYVIDYQTEDFTRNNIKYDIIIDLVVKSKLIRGLKSLKKSGFYILANPTLPNLLIMFWLVITKSRKKVKIGSGNQKIEDLNYLIDLLKTNKIQSVIDKIFPLEKISEAHRYVERGRKKGHVVIQIEQGN